MANSVLPVAKSRISIGTATATYDETTLAADTYTKIGRTRSIGGFGDSAQTISVDEIDDGRTRKGKGTRNAGTTEIVCTRQSDDAGQIAMKEAVDSDEAFNFKVELRQPDGSFEVNFLSALVMSKPKGLGGPNDTQTITFMLEINEAPIEVEPLP